VTRVAGKRGGSRVAVVGLSLALVVACGDDDEPNAADTSAEVTTSGAPTSTEPVPAPTTTTVAPATTAAASSIAAETVPGELDPAVAAQLQAAIDAYDVAYALATAAPGDPSHVDFLAATTDGDLRLGVQNAIAERRAAGQALRPGPFGVVLVQRLEAVETVNEQEATVLTCLFNGSERYVVETGEVLDDSQVSWQNRVVLQRGEDGHWRVHAGERVGDSSEVEANPCT